MYTITKNAHTQKNPSVSDIGTTVTCSGTVYKIRRMKGFSFLILQTYDTLVQCVADEPLLPALTEQCRVTLTGYVVENETAHRGFELRVQSLRILSAPYEKLPITVNGHGEVPLETALSYRTASLRREETRAIFRISSAIKEGCASFFSENGFVSVHTPKLCSGTAESGAGVFSVDYFGKEAFLTTSPQLYKQMMVAVFPRVYEIAPVFRAEPHDTSRHLNEYTGIDCEVGFITDVRTLMEIEAAMLAHMLSYVREHAHRALAQCSVSLPSADEIPAIPFREVKAILARHYPHIHVDSDDLTPPEEKAISSYVKELYGNDFLFVTAYPTSRRPFYTLECPKDPLFSESFDLLFHGIEITTGGLRIHDYETQYQKMLHLGIDPAVFSDYLSAHRYGLPPHGGFGLGLERLTAALCNLNNIREAALFPRDTKRLTP